MLNRNVAATATVRMPIVLRNVNHGEVSSEKAKQAAGENLFRAAQTATEIKLSTVRPASMKRTRTTTAVHLITKSAHTDNNSDS